MNKAGKVTSIRKEIFRSSIIFSLIILIVLGVFLANILYREGISKAYDIIKQRNYAVNFFINGYFSEINNTINILASNKDVQNAPWLDSAARQRVLDLYKSFGNINKNITFIYSGYDNGELLINNYIPPKGFDSTVRPWYKAAMAVKPKIASGIPYQEIKSKEWLFSTSKALMSNDNRYRGVIACDVSIQKVSDMLKQQVDTYKSSYSFVLRPNGEVILHHNKSYLRKKLSEIVDNPVALNKKEGQFVYRIGNVDKIAFYSRCNETNWIVVTVVDKEEIIEPIIRNIFYSIMLVGLVAILLGLLQSALLSRRFSSPLIELRKRVKAIISGEFYEDSSYEYPDNEIGMIAKEVGQLATHELYVKSQELKNANALLEQKNNELKKLSITDRLTGLYNRHKIDTELEIQKKMVMRYKKPFSVIMFDIDWFKKINDTYGHQAGDSVLKEISSILKKNVRNTDIPGRWGGEEFLILCPETDLEGARKLGEKLCSIIANHKFEIVGRVTISVGVCEFSEVEDLEKLLKCADEKLYDAKKRGRNTVVA